MTAGRIIAISTSSFGKLSAEPLERLQARGFEPRLNPHGRKLTTDEARSHLHGAVGILAGTEALTRELLSDLPDLRVVSRVGAGVDNVDADAARELGIAVRNTPDCHVDAVAELALAGMLACARHLPAADRNVRGTWSKPMGRLLRGSTVGIVGLGRVGRALVHLLGPFEVTVLACDVAQNTAFAETHNVRYVELPELLMESDFVTLHVPYSADLRSLIGADELARMRPDAILVNTARGGLVDEVALHDHLRRNPTAGAYLDCFIEEPYEGPLTALDNIVLSSHIGSYARECRIRMEREAVDNLLSVLEP